MREIVLDTETTGLSPESGDRIVEIACLELKNHVSTENYYQVYINPEREMSAGSIHITGITTEFLMDKPLFKEVAKDFLEFIQDSTLIIHNAKFDVNFLNHELNVLHNFNYAIEMERCIDTLEIARQKYPGSPNNLDALCKRFDIDKSKRTKHGALIDCELLAAVYLELIGGAQCSLFATNKYESLSETLQKKRETPKPYRAFPATKEEKDLHKSFLEKDIKNYIWKFKE